MSVEDLPRTIEWIPARANWVPSALTPTGFDDAAAHLRIVDQRRLPHELVFIDCFTSKQVIDAIADLTVRGAPALGVAGAFALVLWAKNEWPTIHEKKTEDRKKLDPYGEDVGYKFLGALKKRAREVSETRPTAVNLSWGTKEIVTLVQDGLKQGTDLGLIVDELEARAILIARDEEESSKRIGVAGADVLEGLSISLGRPLRVQTHCNAGSLATVRLGTATAVIYEAHKRGLIESVWVDETRPVEQGARLTMWELQRAGVPCKLVCDNMAGTLMQEEKVDAIIVGADRICANGDVANKIGTYTLAVLAQYHKVPFYVAAPQTSFDKLLASGKKIKIEQRDAQEVRCMPSRREWLPVAPIDCDVYNPAFDVTPAELITKVITDE